MHRIRTARTYILFLVERGLPHRRDATADAAVHYIVRAAESTESAFTGCGEKEATVRPTSDRTTDRADATLSAVHVRHCLRPIAPEQRATFPRDLEKERMLNTI